MVDETYLPRFHPLVTSFKGVEGWYVCDGHADTEHSLSVPYIEEPADDYDQCLDICGILNEDDSADNHKE